MTLLSYALDNHIELIYRAKLLWSIVLNFLPSKKLSNEVNLIEVQEIQSRSYVVRKITQFVGSW